MNKIFVCFSCKCVHQLAVESWAKSYVWLTHGHKVMQEREREKKQTSKKCQALRVGADKSHMNVHSVVLRVHLHRRTRECARTLERRGNNSFSNKIMVSLPILSSLIMWQVLNTKWVWKMLFSISGNCFRFFSFSFLFCKEPFSVGPLEWNPPSTADEIVFEWEKERERRKNGKQNPHERTQKHYSSRVWRNQKKKTPAVERELYDNRFSDLMYKRQSFAYLFKCTIHVG